MKLGKLIPSRGLVLNLAGPKNGFSWTPQKVSLPEGLLPVKCALGCSASEAPGGTPPFPGSGTLRATIKGLIPFWNQGGQSLNCWSEDSGQEGREQKEKRRPKGCSVRPGRGLLSFPMPGPGVPPSWCGLAPLWTNCQVPPWVVSLAGPPPLTCRGVPKACQRSCGPPGLANRPPLPTAGLLLSWSLGAGGSQSRSQG